MIVASLQQAGGGEDIARIATRRFTLAAGQQRNGMADLPWLRNVFYGQGPAATSMAQRGVVGFGEFAICISAIDVQGREITERCFEKRSIPIQQLSLIYPLNSSAIKETRPNLVWHSALGFGLSELPLSYELTLVKTDKGHSANAALQRNPPILLRNYLKNNSLLYPIDAPRLRVGESYAWEVRVKSTEGEFLRSQQWTFTVKEDKPKEKPLHVASFAMLDSKPGTSYHVFRDHLQIGLDNNENLTELSYSIYRQVVKPVLNQERTISKNKILIIPDGSLWNLNFDLLLSSDEQSVIDNSWPFLIKDYAINYQYATALSFEEQSEKDFTQGAMLAFSYGDTEEVAGEQISFETMRSEFVELPGSRKEIRAVADIIDGDYYYGEFASEEKFKQIAKDYQIIHLAVHGNTNNENPEYSKLDFYNKSDSVEDGKLHAFELYNMKLNADLAVLSACNTGSGKVVNGEGVLSLGRAFAYAGVNSLLLTRWEVSDAFTPKIMKVFYQELMKGKRKSDALRIAKLEFLLNADNITSKPLYWSSFYIIGDDSPILLHDKKAFNWWVIFAGIVFVSAIFLMILKLNRTKD